MIGILSAGNPPPNAAYGLPDNLNLNGARFDIRLLADKIWLGQDTQLYIEASAASGSPNVASVVLGHLNIVTGSGSSYNLVAIGLGNQVRGHDRMAFGYGITASNAASTTQDGSVYIAGPNQKLSFYNVPAVARQTLPATPTVADIATALRNLGLIA